MAISHSAMSPLSVAFFHVLFDILTDPYILAIVFIGTVIGMIVGVIPGMGGTVTLALLIPFTFDMSPMVGLAFLAAAKGATTFTGSITAILLNTPGSGSNLATLLDGYPMSKNGEAATAIGASAFSSAAGAIVGIAIMLLMLPLLRTVVIIFGPAEFFILALVGIGAIAVAIQGSVIAGLIGGGLGFMIAFTGFNPITGSSRYTFGNAILEEGYPLVIALIGLFAIAESIKLAVEGGTIAEAEGGLGGSRIRGALEVTRHKILFFQSSIIGFIVGAIPAIGGSVAGFVAYVQARSISSTPELFGTGNIEGVIAVESSNDAKDAGDLVPTLALGIPGSASAAILLGAFLIHGLQPGPRFLVDHIDIAFAIFAALLISNVLTSSLGILVAGQAAKITRVPTPLISVTIISIALPAAYATRNLPFDVFLVVLFGVIGYLFVIANISRIAFTIALVLGPIAEYSYHQALQISHTHVAAFTSPLSIALILLFGIMFIGPPLLRKRRA